jgi:peptidyl-prolyl cis-trans isomerase SurA
MIMRLVFLFMFIISSAQAKLLDKVMAVVDNQVITLSQAKRMTKTLNARKNISPMIYNTKKLSTNQAVDIFVRRQFIRSRLSEIGIEIQDEQVEAQIKNTEKKLGVDRAALLQFLESNGITFDEYFEIIRETMEHNYFSMRVIRPLISVTEQEIKNSFYKKSKDKTLSFKYNLVDFSLEKRKFKKGMLNNFKNILKKFQTSGNLPSNFSDVDTNSLGDITEDGLTKKLKKLLKETDQGSFSDPILIGNDYHIFFVKNKDLVESEIFLKEKEKIRGLLMAQSAKAIADSWFNQASSKHYVKYFYKK